MISCQELFQQWIHQRYFSLHLICAFNKVCWVINTFMGLVLLKKYIRWDAHLLKWNMYHIQCIMYWSCTKTQTHLSTVRKKLLANCLDNVVYYHHVIYTLVCMHFGLMYNFACLDCTSPFMFLSIKETKVRLERREIRGKWGRMDHQDFQVG